MNEMKQKQEQASLAELDLMQEYPSPDETAGAKIKQWVAGKSRGRIENEPIMHSRNKLVRICHRWWPGMSEKERKT